MARIRRVVSVGGLGDGLLTTGALRAMKQKHPSDLLYVYCGPEQRQIYQGNPFIDRLVLLRPWHRLRLRWAKVYRNDYWRFAPSLVVRQPAAQIIASAWGVETADLALDYFPSSAELEWARSTLSPWSVPVILQTGSRCSPNRVWPGWPDLVRVASSFAFIQIGSVSETGAAGAADFRGQTSIRQAMALLSIAGLFVGIDSVFNHAANAVGAHGVVLFGDSSPEVWGHRTNINIYRAMRCSPCIDLLHGKPCPYKLACIREISVDIVAQALLAQHRLLQARRNEFQACQGGRAEQ